MINDSRAEQARAARGVFEAGMRRRDFLANGAKVAAVAAGASFLGAGQALAAVSSTLDDGLGRLGLVGMDHVGLTVPDVAEAVDWFQDVMGASAPLTFGPFSDPAPGTFMHDLLDVDPRAVVDQITVLRIGHSANIELFQYEAPGPEPDPSAKLRLVGSPHRVLRDRHRGSGCVHGVEERRRSSSGPSS